MRLPFWGTILTLLGLMVLCGLGTWQLQRLAWKEGLINQIDAEYALDASKIDLQGALDGDVDMKRGYVSGAYMHEKSILIQPRTHEGTPGYHVVTPLRLDGGAVLFVNRGWIPIEAERSNDFKLEKSSGRIKVMGVLRRVPKDNMFVPQNDPDNESWFRLDLTQISSMKGISEYHDYILYAEEEGQKAVDAYPLSAATRLSLNNNHAQYAFFWFALALAMMGVYLVRFIIPQIKK